MQIEHSILVNAAPDRLFALYADVANWNRWDPDTKASSIDGPFQVGTRGSLTPTKGNTVAMLLTSVVPDRSFTVEAKIPLFRMVFEHELVPVNQATQVTHRVSFSGALAFLLGRMIGAQLNKGLPVTLAKLKATAEATKDTA
jgi:Polyketide cyclase / dehydrase and lipid transport